MKKKMGIYIHIPFCKRKCDYCDFISFEDNSIQDQYINALKKEILQWKKENSDVEITTVYIGGGTPSFIKSEYIKEILNILEVENLDIEKTIEINPGTVTRKKISDYKIAGINRVSIGLQSTNDNLLKEIGRIHNFEQFINTYKIVKDAGFTNINVDLMIGLPNQTIEDIKESLDKITNLNIQHISVYSLIVEDETKIATKIDKSELTLPSEEKEREMYWYVKQYLESNGYIHYEISNFAKKGYESKHNTDCWKQKEYRGFGIAAHSYINKTRFSNIQNIKKYISNIESNNFYSNIIIQEQKQNIFDEEKEFMLLGLRKINGIQIKEFKNKFEENPLIKFKNELLKLKSENLISIDDENIKLTNKGIDLANLVWEEFV